ncbi:MoxR family ATPase [Micromonospora ureilytica]|uniref:AAA family ATPase n=1 Tax=Micromonospora ureilytica TaxID=709868 RepID=UPI002E15306B|nr:MoxR family ATPase [Micromonospora ureilytica]
MAWKRYYHGDGVPRNVELDPPPPWRRFPRAPLGAAFQPPEGLTDVVNAALSLRRPLLITGPPGTGKSTVIESVAAELRLGPILRWHITSRSTLTEALYRYDVLGRIHAQQLKQNDDIALFLQLGPLGTALMPSDRPRALLIDEIDKSDLDLASDMLDVLERGEYEIPELARYEQADVPVRLAGSADPRLITNGRIQCTEFPFIVMTSNGERDFPPPFLRRCIRYTMPTPTPEMLAGVVRAHLQLDAENAPLSRVLVDFHDRLVAGDNLAIDQLLNALFILSDGPAPGTDEREAIVSLLLRDLSQA